MPLVRVAGIKLKIVTVYGKTWHVVFSELDTFFYKLYHRANPSASLRLMHFTKEITCFVHDHIEIKKLQSKVIATCYLCVMFLYAISMYMYA